MNFSETYEKNVDKFLDKNALERLHKMKVKQESNPSCGGNFHSYSLEKYGLSEDLIYENFADYISKYKL